MARIKCVDLEGEEWRDMEDAEAYQVSSMGRVRSVGPRGYLITPQISKQVSRGDGGGQRFVLRAYLNRKVSWGWVKYIYIHVEVAKAFLEEPYEPSKIIFRDGDSLNCYMTNLGFWYEAPPIDHNGLAEFRRSVKTDIGRKVISFMDGNSGALDKFIVEIEPKMRRKLQSKFKGVCWDKVNEAVHIAMITGLRDINRGLLRKEDAIYSWFHIIAKNKLIGMMRKDRGEISQYGFSGGEEFDRLEILTP